MKPSVSRIERMLEKIEARLVPPPRKCPSAIVHGDDEARITPFKAADPRAFRSLRH